MSDEKKVKEIHESWWGYLKTVNLSNIDFESLLMKKKQINELEDMIYLINDLKYRVEDDDELDADIKNDLLKKFIDKKTELEKKMIDVMAKGTKTEEPMEEEPVEEEAVTELATEELAPKESVDTEEPAAEPEVAEAFADSHFSVGVRNDSWGEVDKTKLPDSAFAYIKDNVRKFPHHNSDGTLNMNGLNAANAAIHGARSGQNLVDEYPGASGHINKHLAKQKKAQEDFNEKFSELFVSEAIQGKPLVEHDVVIEMGVFEAIQPKEGEKVTWETFQNVPARMISPGLSLNGDYFYPAETLKKQETIDHFEGCKGYSNHQPRDQRGEARRNEDLVCKFFGVRALESGSLIADKTSFYDNDKARNIRTNLAVDPMAHELSIASQATGREAELDGRTIYIIESFIGPKPSCDIVTQGARGGNFTDIEESLTQKPVGTDEKQEPITEDQGGNMTDFKTLSLEERLALVKGDTEVMESLLNKELQGARKEIKTLSEGLEKQKSENEELSKHFVAMKRTNEINSLEKKIMEHVASKDFGELGAPMLKKISDKWQNKIEDLRSGDAPLFDVTEAVGEIDFSADLIVPLIKEAAKISPETKAPEIKVDLSEADKTKKFGEIEELFSHQDEIS